MTKHGHPVSRDAIDGGVTFFDDCWEYHRGKSEEWMGRGLKGVRDKVFLMTKVCTHGRDKDLALRMLEQSLRRLQTDYLDLWQVHGVSFENDPDLFIRPGGAAEALAQAKKEGQGPVRRVHGSQRSRDPYEDAGDGIRFRFRPDAAQSVRCSVSKLRATGGRRN